jgi:hypothetical protein
VALEIVSWSLPQKAAIVLEVYDWSLPLSAYWAREVCKAYYGILNPGMAIETHNHV